MSDVTSKNIDLFMEAIYGLNPDIPRTILDSELREKIVAQDDKVFGVATHHNTPT